MVNMVNWRMFTFLTLQQLWLLPQSAYFSKKKAALFEQPPFKQF